MKYKIVIDSCGELLDRWKTDEKFESIPLTLTVGGEDIVDDESFNQAEFLEKVAQWIRNVPNPPALHRKDIVRHLTVMRSMCMQ